MIICIVFLKHSLCIPVWIKAFQNFCVCKYWNISRSNNWIHEPWSFWEQSPVVEILLCYSEPELNKSAFEYKTNSWIKSLECVDFSMFLLLKALTEIFHGLYTHIIFGYLICHHKDILKWKIALAFGSWIMIWLNLQFFRTSLDQTKVFYFFCCFG